MRKPLSFIALILGAACFLYGSAALTVGLLAKGELAYSQDGWALGAAMFGIFLMFWGSKKLQQGIIRLGDRLVESKRITLQWGLLALVLSFLFGAVAGIYVVTEGIGEQRNPFLVSVLILGFLILAALFLGLARSVFRKAKRAQGGARNTSKREQD